MFKQLKSKSWVFLNKVPVYYVCHCMLIAFDSLMKGYGFQCIWFPSKSEGAMYTMLEINNVALKFKGKLNMNKNYDKNNLTCSFKF